MSIFKRRRKPVTAGELKWFEKSMFTFMGPPQLGENKPREGYTPDPDAELCHKCGVHWDAHERVHTGTVTYRRCPPRQ